MQFRTRIASATFDEPTATWTLTTEDGTQLRSRFVVSATGVLSVPYWPSIPGRERYRGEAYHTGQWPKEPVDFAGKKVAVIGTGASAVQLIPEVAKEVAELVVYQRTPNWNSPLNNGKITDEEQAEIKATYDQIYDSCMGSFAGFVHRASRKRAFDDSKEERWALYEQLYHQKGFAKLISNYRDTMTNREANAEFSEFIAEKIRARVDDPVVAEKLIPTDHGFGMRRPPMETFYYEAYNRPNVHLVDLNETPITTITEAGIETSDGERAFDIIVWATGFDGFTGALTRMDVVGEGGRVLRDQWAQRCHHLPRGHGARVPELLHGRRPAPDRRELPPGHGDHGRLHHRRPALRPHQRRHLRRTRQRSVRGVDRRGARGRHDRTHGRELVVPRGQHPRQEHMSTWRTPAASPSSVSAWTPWTNRATPASRSAPQSEPDPLERGPGSEPR